ncbi:hypothetical protein K491DRAFT_778106 [Lophiostoma macrostomum CBS 122681]|uniref:Uncharacterized protein n=1 Tax=Lophiostoma macrostomum CBS 122681 TaxID=1314788 RepID=A0A6A6T909_9PLEO|nr:hypothetical protein K491DRAFT_778106 [Lophiostoma macrostomum CBS 122681]
MALCAASRPLSCHCPACTPWLRHLTLIFSLSRMANDTRSLLDRWMSEQKDLHVSGASMVKWDEGLRELREHTASPFERGKKRPADGNAEEMDEKAIEVRREMVSRFQRQLLEIRASQLQQELRKLDDDIKKVGEQRRRASLAITSYQSAKCASIEKGYSHMRGPLAAIQQPNYSTLGTGSVASGSTIGSKRAIQRPTQRGPLAYLTRGSTWPTKLEPTQGPESGFTRKIAHLPAPQKHQDRIFKVTLRPRPKSLPPTRAASISGDIVGDKGSTR